MIPQFFATEEDIATFRADYALWRKEGFPLGDRNIIPLLEVLNKIPGVATTSSCEGHSGGRSPVARDRDTLYVIAACSTKGYIAFFDFFQRAMQMLRWKMHAYESHRTSPIKGVGHSVPPPFHFTWTATQRTHILHESLGGKEITYIGFAFRAKGTHVTLVRNSLLKELMFIAEKITQPEAVTS